MSPARTNARRVPSGANAGSLDAAEACVTCEICVPSLCISITCAAPTLGVRSNAISVPVASNVGSLSRNVPSGWVSAAGVPLASVGLATAISPPDGPT